MYGVPEARDGDGNLWLQVSCVRVRAKIGWYNKITRVEINPDGTETGRRLEGGATNKVFQGMKSTGQYRTRSAGKWVCS